MSRHYPGHQTCKERERGKVIHLVTTAPFTCCFEFLETSVTACSHTHNWFIFMAAGGGGVTDMTLRAGVLLYMVQEGSIMVPRPCCAVW